MIPTFREFLKESSDLAASEAADKYKQAILNRVKRFAGVTIGDLEEIEKAIDDATWNAFESGIEEGRRDPPRV